MFCFSRIIINDWNTNLLCNSTFVAELVISHDGSFVNAIQCAFVCFFFYKKKEIVYEQASIIPILLNRWTFSQATMIDGVYPYK